MKYYKKLKVYKNSTGSNVVDLENMIATSYGWWPYLKLINGKVVFNNGTYSPTTRKHQNNCLRVLEENNIDIDIMLYSTSHLDDLHGIWNDYRAKVIHLIRMIKRPRSRKVNNLERIRCIKGFRKQMSQIKELMKAV